MKFFTTITLVFIFFVFIIIYKLNKKAKVSRFWQSLQFAFFNVRSSTLKNKYRCSKENMIAFEKIRATAPRKGSIWDYKTKVKFMSWSKVLP